MNLLLVEDAKPDARLIQILLGDVSDPIDITHVTTLGDALNCLAESDFDCAMVDLGLPDGQGVENIQRIHSLSPLLPIVVMTGLNDEQTAAAAISQGAHAYLIKGSFDDGDALKSIIDEAIAAGGTEDSTRAETDDSDRVFGNLARTASVDDTFCCDMDGNIDHWSDGARKVYGYDTDSALGTNIESFIPDDRPTEWPLIRRRIESGESMHGFETVRVDSQGKKRLVELYISPRLDSKGEVSGSVWITRDITTHKTAESAARQLAAIVESSRDAIIGTKLDTTIISWNRGATELLGYDENEAMGEKVALIMLPEFRDSINALVKRVTSDKHVAQITTQLLHKQGKRIDVSISISPVRGEDGSIVGISGIVRDISDLKHAQEQLLQAEKLASLGGLVAGVAHEINTPVGVGVTAASHLRRKVEDFNSLMQDGGLKKSQLDKFLANCDESSQIILSNLKRAAELIHSFKMVAVDQSSSEARRFKVNEYLHEILRSLHPQIKRTRHVINVHCDDELEIDSIPGVWSQIITNLIQNSLIHAFDDADEGQIDIRIEPQGQNLRLSYRDNGKGMSPDVAEKIFDPFFTTRRGQGGSGLGMNVVFNLATRKLGGEIEVQSKPGQGTEFILTVPRKEAET